MKIIMDGEKTFLLGIFSGTFTCNRLFGEHADNIHFYFYYLQPILNIEMLQGRLFKRVHLTMLSI